MAQDYIPKRDANYTTWLANFSTLITATPAAYGLLAGDATAIAAQNTAWAAAYALVTSPTTKTAATVAAKDTERTVSQATIRPYAQRIANNAGVSSMLKIGLGLNPRQNTPTPIPAPVTSPTISVAQAMTNQLVLRYKDSLAAPSVKAKPFGAIAAELHMTFMASGTPTASIDTWPVVGNFTKSPAIVTLPPTNAGQVVFLAARWTTLRGLKGPYGATIQTIAT